MSDILPDQSEKRRLIIPLDGAGWERLIDEGDREGILTDPSVTVLKLTPKGRKQPLQVSLQRFGLLEPGVVLSQSPFERDQYWRVEHAKLRGSIHKYCYFVRLCQLMGARSVVVEEIRQVQKGQSWTFKVDATIEGIGGNGKFGTEEAETLTSEINLKVRFRGVERWWGKNPQKARELLRAKHLDQDHEFVRLVELGTDRSNRLEAFEFNLSLAEESSRNSELFLKLGLPPYVEELVGGFKRKIEESSSFVVKVKVDM